MKRLLLHIGTGKTGSSALQSCLKKKHKEERLKGINYPKIGTLSNHNELCSIVMPHERVRRDIRSKYPKDNHTYKSFVHKVYDELDKSLSNKSGNVVLSGEYFCGFSDDEVRKFKNVLDEYNFSQIEVVVYFRPPVELYLSQVQQRIKASSGFANPQKYKFPYKDIYRRWKHVFGTVTVRSFKRSDLIGGDIVRDFFSVLERCFELSIPAPNNVESANESLSSAGMLIQHEYRKFIYPSDDNIFKADSKRLLKEIIYAEKTCKSMPKPRLKDWVKKSVADNNSGDIKWLKESFGFDFSYKEIGNLDKQNSFRGDLRDVLVVDAEVEDKRAELTSIVLKQLLGS